MDCDSQVTSRNTVVVSNLRDGQSIVSSRSVLTSMPVQGVRVYEAGSAGSTLAGQSGVDRLVVSANVSKPCILDKIS